MLRNILQRIDNLLLIRTRVSYNEEIKIKTPTKYSTEISKCINDVDQIIKAKVEEMLKQYPLSSDTNAGNLESKKTIIKLFITSEMNNTPYPGENNSYEKISVEIFFDQSVQSQIKQSSKTLVQNLGILLREVLVSTLNKLKEQDDPEYQIQCILQRVLDRLRYHIDKRINISGFQKFIDEMNIDI